jgi:uncharacterized protein (TIGR02246 family)
MKWMLLAPLALTIANPAAAQTTDPDEQARMEAGTTDSWTRVSLEPSYQIRKGMEDSAAGWNGGDVDRFLAIYSDDPATSFTGSDGIRRGKKDIRARYLVSYHDQFAGMASAVPTRLSFKFEDFRMVGTDYALLIARWTLVTFASDTGIKSGMTSLLFHHEAGGWKIVADHSS